MTEADTLEVEAEIDGTVGEVAKGTDGMLTNTRVVVKTGIKISGGDEVKVERESKLASRIL